MRSPSMSRAMPRLIVSRLGALIVPDSTARWPAGGRDNRGPASSRDHSLTELFPQRRQLWLSDTMHGLAHVLYWYFLSLDLGCFAPAKPSRRVNIRLWIRSPTR